MTGVCLPATGFSGETCEAVHGGAPKQTRLSGWLARNDSVKLLVPIDPPPISWAEPRRTTQGPAAHRHRG